MSEIDMLLRDTLRERAEEAPSATELLGKVRARSGRLAARRRVGTAGILSVVVLATAAVIPLGVRLMRFAPPASHNAASGGGGPVAGPPASPPFASPAQPSLPQFAITLAPPVYSLPVFPFLPPPAAVTVYGPARAWLDSDGITLRHTPASASAPAITVQVTEAEPRVPQSDAAAGAAEKVVVRGVPAQRRDVGAVSASSLTWQERTGLWVLVTGYGVRAGELQEYAEGMVPGVTTVAAPFEFPLLPRGMELEQTAPSLMVFRPAGLSPGAGLRGKLAVRLQPVTAPADAASWPLKTAGHRARIYRNGPDSRLVQVSLDKTRILSIQIWDNFTAPDDTLLKLAGGVRVTQVATPATP